MSRVRAGSARSMRHPIFVPARRTMPSPGSAPSRPRPSADPVIGALAAAVIAGSLVPYQIIGDAIPASLTGTSGDPVRGRSIVLDRRLGACLLCHSGPFPEEKFQG